MKKLVSVLLALTPVLSLFLVATVPIGATEGTPAIDETLSEENFVEISETIGLKVQATLTDKTVDGTSIEGTDTVNNDF